MFRFLHSWWQGAAPQKPLHVQPSLESLEMRDLCAAVLPFSGSRPGSEGWGYAISAASDLPVSEQDPASPTISDFEAVQEAPGIWTFRGRVTGDDLVGMDVTLGGLPSLNGQVVQVEEDGWFYCTVQLQPGEHGKATAQASDWLGHVSNVAVTRVPRW
jgi:hypothetical protein